MNWLDWENVGALSVRRDVTVPLEGTGLWKEENATVDVGAAELLAGTEAETA